MTARCGWKDKDNNLIFGERLPAGLSDLTGCVIEEHETLLSGQSSPCVFNGKEGQGLVFEELLALKGAEELVSWKDNPYGRFTAATVNRYGRGRCFYLGSSFDEETLTALFDDILV